MSGKKEKNLERIEVAQEFVRLSGQMADGFLEVDGRRIELPEKVIFKKLLKTKGNEVLFELSIKTTIEGLGVRDDSRARGKKQSRKGSERGGKRPYKAKRLKKEISIYWKALKRCVKNRERFRDRDGFLKALAAYSQFADRQWAEQWERCASLVQEVMELSEKGHVDEALERCVLVDDITRGCHKQYK